MSLDYLKHNIDTLNQVGRNKEWLFSFFIRDKDSLEKNWSRRQYKISVLVGQLMKLRVTKVSLFEDSVWDYNSDILNPPRSVQGSSLRVDFSKYSYIPNFIIMELKCLLHYVSLSPTYFGKRDKYKKRRYLKHNTVVAHFKSGLRFLDQLFRRLHSNGSEFVLVKYRSIVDILEREYRDTAREYTYRVDSDLHAFISYLTDPHTKNIFGVSIDVNLKNLPWPKQNIKKRESSLIFENDVFERLVRHSTFKIIDFLKIQRENIDDKTSLKHFDTLKPKKSVRLRLTKEMINDYSVMRLLGAGYSKEFIENNFYIDKNYFQKNGKIIDHFRIRKLILSKYKIKTISEIRYQINEAYYAAAFLIAQYTGMRPSELQEILLDNCIINHEGFDLIISNVQKGVTDNLKLFDDKWLLTPIMKDALKVAIIISKIKNNNYLFSRTHTVKVGKVGRSLSGGGLSKLFRTYLGMIFENVKTEKINFTTYMLRHTLAYQLYRAELGLPFISFQLKHIVEQVGRYTSLGSTSSVTMGYGEIAEKITSENRFNKKIRSLAEIDRVKSIMDPEGIYLGPKGKEHGARLNVIFEGYMEAGYTKEAVFDAMAEQGMAIINVGTGFCFGGVEDFDESIPCIGTLRCNPIRCSNAVVTKANIPKWREVIVANKALLSKVGYEDRAEQINAIINEAEQVLISLGETVD